jgi:hypothetical protein
MVIKNQKGQKNPLINFRNLIIKIDFFSFCFVFLKNIIHSINHFVQYFVQYFVHYNARRYALII